MTIRTGLISTTIAGGLLAALALPAGAAEVTFDRLLNAAEAEPHNWLQVHRTYNAWRYATLDEINRDTVQDLHLVMTVTLGSVTGGGRYNNPTNEATPLAEDGFLYTTDGWSILSKIDVRDGRRGAVIWQMDPEVDRAYASDAACCGADNRGAALIGNDVLTVAIDGRLIATNKDSGEITWEQTVADVSRAEVLTVAPLVIKDMAIIGPAGGEYGIRGWLGAFNVADGTQRWKFNIIPGPDEPGFETWEGRDWETGGGSVWQTGSYDPELNITYWGTGNPSPQFDAEYRPGDNLYTESLVALDADTGELQWHFQFTPNDPYDWDEIGEAQLIDVEVDGQTQALVARAARNGFMYAFDRASGEFQYGIQYVEHMNWTTGIDQKTGLPLSYDPNVALQRYVPGTAGTRGGPPGIFCPTLGGGKNWQPAAYNPVLQTLYVPSNEGCSAYVATEAPAPTVVGGEWDLRDARGWRGRAPAPEGTVLPTDERRSSLSAIDPVTGERRVKIMVTYRPHGMLATSGGLVFAADQSGALTAYNDETLEVVWSWNIGTSMKAPPMTYAVDGKQYIAVMVGSVPSSYEKEQDPALQFYAPVNALYIFSL